MLFLSIEESASDVPTVQRERTAAYVGALDITNIGVGIVMEVNK